MKFEHIEKLYMHKPEFLLEYKTLKILWNIVIKMNHPTPARNTNPILIKNRTFSRFCCSMRPRNEKEEVKTWEI